MAKKVLGQVATTASTAHDVYTVPAAKTAVVSTLSFCNASASAVTYDVAVRPAGATLATAHYLLKGVGLPATGSDFVTIGVTLGAGDVITVVCSGADLAVSIFGDES